MQVSLFLLLAPAVFSNELTGILIVEISGLKHASGNVYIAVYESDSTWLSDDTIAVKKLAIVDALDGDLVRTELHLPLGDYALTAFHDIDNDGELDTSFIGMPKEPIAMSNNAVARFGPPKFEDAVFTLGAKPMIQHITIRAL